MTAYVYAYFLPAVYDNGNMGVYQHFYTQTLLSIDLNYPHNFSNALVPRVLGTLFLAIPELLIAPAVYLHRPTPA